ncbi:hypothetical protein HK104_005257 [Borealophlyctis nickersoniae]|nr:hypothetical protein HK104_005257 [Borealophlyctis nickersoniae]
MRGVAGGEDSGGALGLGLVVSCVGFTRGAVQAVMESRSVAMGMVVIREVEEEVEDDRGNGQKMGTFTQFQLNGPARRLLPGFAAYTDSTGKVLLYYNGIMESDNKQHRIPFVDEVLDVLE